MGRQLSANISDAILHLHDFELTQQAAPLFHHAKRNLHKCQVYYFGHKRSNNGQLINFKSSRATTQMKMKAVQHSVCAYGLSAIDLKELSCHVPTVFIIF